MTPCRLFCTGAHAFGLASSAMSGGVPRPELIQCAVTLDKAILPEHTDNGAILRVALEPGDIPDRSRPPLNLAIVVDRSESMRGPRLAMLKRVAWSALRKL